MNRPSPSDFILGRRGGGAVFFCLAFYSIYLSAAQGVSWLVPVVVIVLGRRARHARQRVAVYRQWKGAWDEMAGDAPQTKLLDSGKRQRRRAFAIRAGGVLWLVLALWLMTHGQARDTPRYMTFGVMFWLLSVWGTGAALLWAGRGIFRGGTASAGTKPAREHIVTVCLPVPWRSPSPAAIRARLPAHCLHLLSRQDSAPPATSGEAQHAPSPPN